MTAATANSGTMLRHTRDHPCDVCGGHADLRQGQGVRCAGFTLDRVIYCTREEYAGNLAFDLSTSPPAYKHRRAGDCDCGRQHDWAATTPAPIATLPKPKPSRHETAPLASRATIYRAALDLLPLRPAALADLTRRGLTPEEARTHGYVSIPRKGTEARTFITTLTATFGEAALRRIPGFTDKNDRLTFWTDARGDGYVVPYRDEQGNITGLQLKLLDGKYLTARGTNLGVIYNVAGARGAGDLYLTEGATKGYVAAVRGGLWTFAVAGQALAAEHVAVIARLAPQRVVIALDQEANVNTDRARERWAQTLHAAGLDVFQAVWEGDELGGPKGLDDLVAAGGRPRRRRTTSLPAELGERRMPAATDTPGAVAGGVDLTEARRITQRAVATIFDHPRSHKGTVTVVRSDPGAGKTTAVAAAAQRSHANARILVGTAALARELAEEHGYQLFQGRNRETCHEDRLPVVHALGRKGFPIAPFACGTPTAPRCPFRLGCAYWRQADTPGTRVGTTEQLFNPRFLDRGSVLVVDDADLGRALIERHHFAGEALDHAAGRLRRAHRRPIADLLDLLRHAIIDAPRHETGDGGPPQRNAAFWDHLARTAARQGQDLATLIGALPQTLTVPEPAADEANVLHVEDVEAAIPANVVRLCETLRAELPQFLAGEDFNSSLRLHPGGIDVWTLKPHVVRRNPQPDQSAVVIADMALLVLDATPVEPLIAHLAQHHERLPDVAAAITIPPNVRIVQHAEAGNGHTVMRGTQRRDAVLRQIVAERRRFPVDGPEREAAVGFKAYTEELQALGFADDRVLSFGSARGTNVLAGVERLHIVGRPTPPPDELLFLAAVLHPGESPIREDLTLTPRTYGGQLYAIPVVDFTDARVAALLKSARDDEVVQVLHRARFLNLDPQMSMDAPEGAAIGIAGRARTTMTLVLHTSHPVPGLRVDELLLAGGVRHDVNAERAADAEARILAAAQALQQRGEPVTARAVSRESRVSRRVVNRILGTVDHTPKEDLSFRGVIHRPHTTDAEPPEASPATCVLCSAPDWQTAVAQLEGPVCALCVATVVPDGVPAARVPAGYVVRACALIWRWRDLDKPVVSIQTDMIPDIEQWLRAPGTNWTPRSRQDLAVVDHALGQIERQHAVRPPVGAPAGSA